MGDRGMTHLVFGTPCPGRDEERRLHDLLASEMRPAWAFELQFAWHELKRALWQAWVKP